MAVFPSAAESSRQDANQSLSITVVQGSAGTATAGTTLTMPVTGDPVTGAMYVNNIGAPSGNPTAGTLNTLGTVGTILGIGGTVTTTGGGTTPVNVISGTQQTLGTVGVVNNLVTGTLAAGTITQLIPGTTATTLGKSGSQQSFASGDVGVGFWGVRNENFTTYAGAEGQYIPIQLDRFGRVFMQGQLNTGTINSDTVTGGTLQNLVSGTINALASGTITTGTVSVTTGTMINNGGSVSIQGLQANAAAAVGNPFPVGGTDSGGTVRSILVDSTGVQRSSGSVVMTVGTLTTGTLQNLVTGTINALATGTITAGTLTNLATGTINALASGTITTGTVSMTTGTLSPLPTIANSPFGTHGTTGVSIFGTLAGGAGAGAGTEIFITSLSLSLPSTAGSQDVSIGWGTNAGTFHAGTGLLVRGNFLAGGGIQKTFWPPVNSGTNGQLCYFQAGAGTVDISVTYFITASTL